MNPKMTPIIDLNKIFYSIYRLQKKINKVHEGGNTYYLVPIWSTFYKAPDGVANMKDEEAFPILLKMDSMAKIRDFAKFMYIMNQIWISLKDYERWLNSQK